MSARRAPLPISVLALVVLLGACGGSKSASDTVAGARPTRSTQSTAATRSARTARSSAATRSTATTPATASGAPTNARVPATFVIGADGRVSPASVSSPASFAVQLTAVSADGRAHRALLRTPRAYSLSVPPRGRASVLIAGLRAGRYVLDVDGVSRGTLIIGGEPGP